MSTTTDVPAPPRGLVSRDARLAPTMEPTGLSEAALYKQAGNAVCVGAVSAVARPLLAAGAGPMAGTVTIGVVVDPAFAPPTW